MSLREILQLTKREKGGGPISEFATETVKVLVSLLV